MVGLVSGGRVSGQTSRRVVGRGKRTKTNTGKRTIEWWWPGYMYTWRIMRKINIAEIISRYYFIGHCWSLWDRLRLVCFLCCCCCCCCCYILLCGSGAQTGDRAWYSDSFSAESCQEELEVYRIHSILINTMIINTNINISLAWENDKIPRRGRKYV